VSPEEKTEPTHPEPAGPVFIGGVPRSGSHVLGHILASHSRFALIPREVVFHSEPDCLTGFVRGRVERDAMLKELRERWWPQRPEPHGRGLEGLIERRDFEAALEGFDATPGEDRAAAGATLLRSLLDPLALKEGKPSWVERSQLNVASASSLLSMFPNARVIHIVRDGRDVGSSLARLPIGPETVPDAIRYWARRLRVSDRGARSAPSDRLIVMHLEDLVLLDRKQSYERLLEFVGLEDEPGMRSFFESEATPQRAHIGRWAVGLSRSEREETESLYKEVLAELHADGVSCAPDQRSIAVTYVPGDAEPPNPYDPWAGFGTSST
jgi:hypothetical protein